MRIPLVDRTVAARRRWHAYRARQREALAESNRIRRDAADLPVGGDAGEGVGGDVGGGVDTTLTGGTVEPTASGTGDPTTTTTTSGATPSAPTRTGVPLIHQSPFTIGFVGTLKPWHGVEVLLEAFARLAGSDESARLRIVGDGPLREALAAQALRLGVSQRVDLVGAVAPQDMPGELATMDVAVAPYPRLPDFYFSPLKIYEYLAAGVPVVASDIGPCWDILDGGGLGVLVAPGDVIELAAVLAGLRSDARLRAELGESGRRAAVTRHDWSLVVSRILTTIPTRAPSLADDLLGRTG